MPFGGGLTPPPDPPEIRYPIENEKNNVFQNASYDIPFDAKFYADFKNA